MIKDLFVFGTGGLAKEITLLVEDIKLIASSKYSIVKYVVINPKEPSFMGKDIISEKEFYNKLEGNEQVSVVLAIGTPSVRQRIVNGMSKYNIDYPCLIHPSSTPNPSVHLKEGTIVCSNVIFTVDVTVGKHAYINFGCSLAHDVEIGDFVQINPSCCISGKVRIGDSCLIGVGSIIHEGIDIGQGSTVGIGSVVLRNVKENTTVFGNPARTLPSAGKTV